MFQHRDIFNPLPRLEQAYDKPLFEGGQGADQRDEPLWEALRGGFGLLMSSLETDIRQLETNAWLIIYLSDITGLSHSEIVQDLYETFLRSKHAVRRSG